MVMSERTGLSGSPSGSARSADVALGRPLPRLHVADLTGCDALAELGPQRIDALFAEALERAGATIVNRVRHVFPGDGMTSVLVLAESHAVLHTWPESGTVNVDIVSCSGRLNGRDAIQELSRILGARQVMVQEIPRADGHVRVSEPDVERGSVGCCSEVAASRLGETPGEGAERLSVGNGSR
jgi:S-adenosylmethionine decarboxylase